jgi:hypothetical protein
MPTVLDRRNNRLVLLVALACLTTSLIPTGNALAEPTDVSWQTADKVTASDGDIGTREGTATFANGEKAHIVSRVAHGPNASGMSGTATVDQVYKFDDGSGFSLRFVGIWNSVLLRTAALFTEGSGRFAGIRGGATGAGVGASLGTIAWTGTYDLPQGTPIHQ